MPRCMQKKSTSPFWGGMFDTQKNAGDASNMPTFLGGGARDERRRYSDSSNWWKGWSAYLFTLQGMFLTPPSSQRSFCPLC